MTKKFNKIIQDFKQEVVLSKDEKQSLWSVVDAYVYNNPERKPVISRGWLHIMSPYFIHTQRLAILSIAIVFVVGGTTSLAAQSALPNNALYTIKVNVNEEVQSWFSFGAESRAYFEIKRAGDRLEEAKTLAVMGELDTESKDIIKKNFEKHAHKVQEQIATVEAANDLKTAIDIGENFEKSLKEHSKTLVQIVQDQEQEKLINAESLKNNISQKETNKNTEINTTNDPVDSSDIDIADNETFLSTTTKTSEEMSTKNSAVIENKKEISEISNDINNSEKNIINNDSTDELIQIVNTVQANIEVSAQVREEVESKIPTLTDTNTRKTAAEDKRKDATDQIEKVSSLLATTTLSVKAEDITVASTTLDTAVKFVADGDTKFNAQSYGDAFLLFRNGLDTAVKAEHVLLPPTPIKSTTVRSR